MIHLDQVSVSLNSQRILQEVSLAFTPGLNFLIGLNGSGKTTLLKCIYRDVPYLGNISLTSLDIQTFSPKEFARHIAIVHQTWNIPFRFNVFDFVMMGRFPYLSWWGGYQKEDYQQVRKELQRLKVDHLAQRALNEVSGGELQRILLARALSQETPILLLDEPAQSLDPKGRLMLYQLLAMLATQQKTIICTSHDIDLIQIPDAHIWAIKEGKLLFHVRGEEIDDSLINQVYDLDGVY